MSVTLGPRQSEQYLEVLSGLLQTARPGTLFPDAARLRVWLSLFGQATPKGLRFKLAVHERSGFPERRALERFHRLQKVARRLLEGARPGPKALAFSAALLKVQLPALSAVTARLLGQARGVDRFAVVYDTLAPRTGCPVRFTAQLEQRRASHIGLDGRQQAVVSPAFAREVAIACEERVEDALVALKSIDGLAVSEVVRAQLGPFVCPPWTSAGGRDVDALRSAVDPGDGVLSLVLDRAGETVTADRNADPWRVLDGTPPTLKRRVALGYKVCLERRLVCTPGVEARVRAVVEGQGVVVRSR